MTILRKLAAALALLLASATGALSHDGIHVTGAHARVTGDKATTAAVYFVIENHGPDEDRLLSVATDAADRADLHASIEDADGMTSMVPMAEGLPVPGGAEHALAPRGDHLMLMGLTRPLRDGDGFDLVLTFAREGEVRVTVPVDNAVRPDAAPTDAMDGMDHDAMTMPAD